MHDHPPTDPAHNAAPLATDEAIRARLHEIERDLALLRRSLATALQRPLPDAPFDALVIYVAAAPYLVPIDLIQEVVPVVWPQPLIEAPPWVLGTFHYGPVLVPIIDTAQRFTGRPSALEAHSQLVVLRQPRWAALLVEQSADVLRVEPHTLSPPPEGLSQALFLRASMASDSDQTFYLLDCDRMGLEALSDATP